MKIWTYNNRGSLGRVPDIILVLWDNCLWSCMYFNHKGQIMKCPVFQWALMRYCIWNSIKEVELALFLTDKVLWDEIRWDKIAKLSWIGHTRVLLARLSPKVFACIILNLLLNNFANMAMAPMLLALFKQSIN
jgi:hypothetical protein